MIVRKYEGYMQTVFYVNGDTEEDCDANAATKFGEAETLFRTVCPDGGGELRRVTLIQVAAG